VLSAENGVAFAVFLPHCCVSKNLAYLKVRGDFASLHCDKNPRKGNPIFGRKHYICTQDFCANARRENPKVRKAFCQRSSCAKRPVQIADLFRDSP
jgi:hypothetical protein